MSAPPPQLTAEQIAALDETRAFRATANATRDVIAQELRSRVRRLWDLGIRPLDIAAGTGISRARTYQLLDGYHNADHFADNTDDKEASNGAGD